MYITGMPNFAVHLVATNPSLSLCTAPEHLTLATCRADQRPPFTQTIRHPAAATQRQLTACALWCHWQRFACTDYGVTASAVGKRNTTQALCISATTYLHGAALAPCPGQLATAQSLSWVSLSSDHAAAWTGDSGLQRAGGPETLSLKPKQPYCTSLPVVPFPSLFSQWRRHLRPLKTLQETLNNDNPAAIALGQLDQEAAVELCCNGVCGAWQRIYFIFLSFQGHDRLTNSSHNPAGSTCTSCCQGSTCKGCMQRGCAWRIRLYWGWGGQAVSPAPQHQDHHPHWWPPSWQGGLVDLAAIQSCSSDLMRAYQGADMSQ